MNYFYWISNLHLNDINFCTQNKKTNKIILDLVKCSTNSLHKCKKTYLFNKDIKIYIFTSKYTLSVNYALTQIQPTIKTIL